MAAVSRGLSTRPESENGDISSEFLQGMIDTASKLSTEEGKFAMNTVALFKNGLPPSSELFPVGRVGVAATADGNSCGAVLLGLTKTEGFYASVIPDNATEKRQLKAFKENFFTHNALPPVDSDTSGLYSYASTIYKRAYHGHSVHGNSLTFMVDVCSPGSKNWNLNRNRIRSLW